MDHTFWLDKWQSGRIGFHRDAPMPLLLQYWPTLGLDPGTRVLVPLAGKSLDMLWLASQGFRVLGVELSPQAVAQFLADNALDAREEVSPVGRHYFAGPIEIICGDVFDVDAASVDDCHALYDRAALIALPPAMRRRYAELLTGILPRPCRMLLLTLDYDQQAMQGPPFAVSTDHVHELYGHDWTVTTLDSRDILDEQPSFAERGLKRLTTSVYGLTRAGVGA